MRVLGLKVDNNTGDQVIDCANCSTDVYFNANNLPWSEDGIFEFTNIECLHCGEIFEVSAVLMSKGYKFFPRKIKKYESLWKALSALNNALLEVWAEEIKKRKK